MDCSAALTMEQSVGWLVIGGRSRGSTHVQTGTPCQDCAYWRQFDGEPPVMAAVVADGAGTASRAHEGSRAAVSQVMHDVYRLRSHSARDQDAAEAIVPSIFMRARHRVFRTARARRLPVSDFSTTLAMLVVWGEHVISAQIGDSLVFVRHPSGELTALARHRGEYANQTAFLTAHVMPKVHSLTFTRAAVAGFILSSDGLEQVITEPSTSPILPLPYRPFVEDVLAFAAQGGASDAVVRFLDRVDDRKGDDKSLVVGWQV